MVCTSEALSTELIEALFDDSNGDLTLIGLEDTQVTQLSIINCQLSINIEPVRGQYNYIYRRTDLAMLHGKHLDAEREQARTKFNGNSETIDVNHARVENQIRFHLHSCAASSQNASILATLGRKGVLPR